MTARGNGYIVLGAFAALVGLHLLIGWDIQNPTIYADEYGYLTGARRLGLNAPPTGVSYYPGYSLVLVPLFRLIDDPVLVYRSVLILNSILLSSTFVLVWKLIPYLTDQSRIGTRLGIASLASLYPPYLVYSNVAMSENLFIPLYLLFVLLLFRTLRKRTLPNWATIGFLAALLALVHPRGFAVVAALAFLCGLVVWRFRDQLPGVGVLAATAGAALYGGILLTGYVTGSGDSRAVSRVLSQGLTLETIWNLLLEAAGQFFYLTAATYGFFVLGLVVALRGLLRVISNRSVTNRDLGLAFLGLSMLGVLALSSLVLSEFPSVDHKIYGRYNEGVLAPILVLGLITALGGIHLASLPSRIAVALAGLTLSGAVLAMGRSADELSGRINWLNVLGLFTHLRWLQRVDVPILTIVAASVGLVAIIGFSRRFVVGFVVLASIFLVVGLDAGHRYFARDAGVRNQQRVVAQTIQRMENTFDIERTCIAYDRSSFSGWYFFNYQYFLFDKQVERFQSTATDSPCSDLVISGGSGFDLGYPGARLVTLENHAPQGLWVLSGSLQEELKEAGWLLPRSLHEEMPLQAYRSEITLSGAQSRSTPPILDVTGATEQPVIAKIRHAGQQSAWPNLAGLMTARGAVRLIVHWYDSDDIIREMRVDMPRVLMPGDEVSVEIPWTPIWDSLEPGEYEIVLGLVHEGVVWFQERGDSVERFRAHLQATSRSKSLVTLTRSHPAF